MRAWGRHLGLAVCAIAAASLFAAPAGAAKSHRTVLPRSLSLEMQVPGSNGYSLRISGYGHRKVYVLVTKGPYYAFYETTGSVSRDHLKADLGRFGRISVRFQAAGRPKHEPSRDGCTGRRPILETGSFRGTIEFDGEQEYTDVSAREAPGNVSRTFRQVCPPGGHSAASVVVVALPRTKPGGVMSTREDGFAITLLAAASKQAGRMVHFYAIRTGEESAGRPSSWILSGGLFERVGRITIAKAVHTEVGASEIQVSDMGVHPASAEVAPGSPFVGTAAFDEAPGPTPDWTGTLSLNLPGAGVIPLAGESFDAALCQTSGIRQLNRCIGAFETQRRPQISGSQSQLFGDARLSWAR